MRAWRSTRIDFAVMVPTIERSSPESCSVTNWRILAVSSRNRWAALSTSSGSSPTLTWATADTVSMMPSLAGVEVVSSAWTELSETRVAFCTTGSTKVPVPR